MKSTLNLTFVSKRTYGAFALLALCLFGFAAAYSLVSWQSHKADELRHAEALVDIGEKSLNTYFSQIEVELRLSIQNLLDGHGRIDLIAAQSRLISLTKANPDLVSANIISLDGLIVLSSHPDSRLPAPVPNKASFNQALDDLSKGQSLSIGLPFIGPFAKEWLIPVRYAVRDAAGSLRYLLTVTLPLSRSQSFWKDAAIPAGMALGLIRDDGYLVSRHPIPSSLDLAEIYGKPRTGGLIKHLQERQFPVEGQLEGPSSLDGPSHFFVFHRLASHPLTFFVTQPISNVRAIWWRSVQVPYLLLLILLVGEYAVFRWMLRAQNAWDAERNDAERTLTDFKAALDQHAIVATTDAQGTLTYVNDKFCAVSRYARHELIGQNHRIVNSGHHPKEFFDELWQTIASGGIWKGEIRNRAKDGAFYWVDTTIVPFLDEHLKPVQYIAIRADITERKEAELALVAARIAAELANRAKDSFLATMSHEIRTPLGGMMGMLELLSLSSLGDEQRETLETARDSGRSLLRILNDILDWSKIEEGKLELSPQAVSIADLVGDVANTYSHVASSNSVTVTQQVDGRLSPAHIVDPLRLSQVLNNFVSNAIKFSHGGRVEIRAELLERHDGSEQVRLSVKDTGIGIDPAVQQRLFRNYGQASADTARMYGGTGLGLAICRRLADMLVGQIGIDSAPGQGSTFSVTLTLPIADAVVQTRQCQTEIVDAAAVQPFDHAVVAARGAPVLVIDDNPINRQLLVRQLGILGLRAETAEDGVAALSLYRTGRFDLIITDCHMPKMDGYALTRAIREIESAAASPRTPIFAWTANALAEESENCRAAGMDELLIKPADLAQLKQVLAKWLPTGVSASMQTRTPTTVPPKGASVAVSPAPTFARLDVSVLAALVGNDPTTIRDFLIDFRSSAMAIVAEIGAACAGGHAAAAGAAAHKLKSSARAVGALALGELCAELDAAGKAADAGGVNALRPRIEAEMAALDAALAAATESGEAPQDRQDIMTDAPDQSATRVMLLDDEPFMLILLEHFLEGQGFTAVSQHSSGYQALNALDGVAGAPDLILLDLNMPEMDGIEFVRHLVERRYAGSIVLLSGEDERTLQAAHTLAQAHNINVLGHLQKPVTQEDLVALLAQWTPRAAGRAPTAKAEYGTDALRAAIADGELVNYYQPTVAVADGRVVGVETLVRWQHPVDGLIFPDQFISVAEAHGLIEDLTRVVLRAALAQTRAWRDAGIDLRVAVNVSMDNLAVLNFADFVAAAAAEAGVAPSAVVLEVTESRLMADLRTPLEILTRLRLKRFRLSIDDFGTGHSSLTQLRDIPFDELKIDRSFVHRAHADPTLQAIFEANLGMARQLGIEVVAEGVEDREDWDFLRRAGCGLAQGYFIARPMPAADLPDWIQTWEARLRKESPPRVQSDLFP